MCSKRAAVMPSLRERPGALRRRRGADDDHDVDVTVAAGLEQQRHVEHDEPPPLRRGVVRNALPRRATAG